MLRRTIRHTPDRLLHPLRRALVAGRMRRRPLPSCILVVCHGNICRSPYAAGALSKRLGLMEDDIVRVESAGFLEAGRSSPREAIAAAASRGVDLRSHRSRPLTQGRLKQASLVVTMDSRQQRAIRKHFGKHGRDTIILGDFDPAPIRTRAVVDPINESREIFDRCYERIDRCIGALAGVLLHGAETGRSRAHSRGQPNRPAGASLDRA